MEIKVLLIIFFQITKNNYRHKIFYLTVDSLTNFRTTCYSHHFVVYILVSNRFYIIIVKLWSHNS